VQSVRVTLPAAADRLFALPLEEFTAARNALAKELGRAQDRDGAAAVKAMRRPSLTAWALNQVSRDRPHDIERLLEASDQLRAAQRDALEGDPTLLRDARHAFQDEVERVLSAAARVLTDAGKAVGPAQLDRLSATVKATATDDEARALVRAGRLQHDLETSGFGFDVESPTVPRSVPASTRPAATSPRARAPAPAPAPTAPAVTPREVRRLATLAERAEARARRLSRDADEAERNARDLRAQADEALEAAGRARRAAEEAAAGHRSSPGDSVP
jgi:hypothetical protein